MRGKKRDYLRIAGKSLTKSMPQGCADDSGSVQPAYQPATVPDPSEPPQQCSLATAPTLLGQSAPASAQYIAYYIEWAWFPRAAETSKAADMSSTIICCGHCHGHSAPWSEMVGPHSCHSTSRRTRHIPASSSPEAAPGPLSLPD